MKRLNIALILILILALITVCFLRSRNGMSSNEFLSYEEITDIYNNNKELINRIKDGLFTSGLIPDVKSISLYYENDQLVCADDPQGENLQSIHNIYNDVVDFMCINKDLRPIIMFREVLGEIIVEFEFRSNYIMSDPRAGIIYKNTPKEPWGEVHLEDNWYAYKYEMP